MHLFVDNLTNVDFSFLHPERGLLGETWMAHIQLEGELDAQGMVCDFGVVKKVLRNWLDDEIDHRLAVPVHSPNLELIAGAEHSDDDIELIWHYGEGNNKRRLRCKCPRQAIALIDSDAVNETSVSRWARSHLAKHFPANIDQLKLDFSCEEIPGAFYHYSHGLKKHAGNCQRIAHGHRSRIEIWKNSQRSAECERLWAGKWRDIYIGTREDIVAMDESTIRYAYTAQQGEFELDMPASDCYLIDSDSTVEFIAHHIGSELKKAEPESTFKVRAFEGIYKGAMVEL